MDNYQKKMTSLKKQEEKNKSKIYEKIAPLNKSLKQYAIDMPRQAELIRVISSIQNNRKTVINREFFEYTATSGTEFFISMDTKFGCKAIADINASTFHITKISVYGEGSKKYRRGVTDEVKEIWNAFIAYHNSLISSTEQANNNAQTIEPVTPVNAIPAPQADATPAHVNITFAAMAMVINNIKRLQYCTTEFNRSNQPLAAKMEMKNLQTEQRKLEAMEEQLRLDVLQDSA